MITSLNFLRECLSDPYIIDLGRSSRGCFTQCKKWSFRDLMTYILTRSADTTYEDIRRFCSMTDRPFISKQAVFKSLNKLNPEVFPVLIRKTAEQIYKTENNLQNLKEYLCIAVDGSHADLPCSEETKTGYGGCMNRNIKKPSDSPSPQAKISILFDVMNHVTLDALIRPCNTSEIPLLNEHLANCSGFLSSGKVLLLTDRYYGSAELFLYCMKHGIDFLVRGKRNFYKEYTKNIEKDGWIEIPFTPAWIKRLKSEECRQYALEKGSLRLRVVKSTYTFLTEKGKRKEEEIIESMYFTSLPEDTFPAEEIVDIYHNKRWTIETAYFDIKDHLEAERLSSAKFNIVTNEIYAKILNYQICCVLYRAVLKKMTKKSDTKYQYKPDIKNIIKTFLLDPSFANWLTARDNRFASHLHRWIEKITQLTDDCARIKVAVRPGRHNKRWGRWMKSIPSKKFRLDGRRNPKIEKRYKGNGYLTRQ